MVMFSSSQQLLPCNLFSEQALMINDGEGETSPKNRTKLQDQRPVKVMQSSRGVKHPLCPAINGDIERKTEDHDSPKHPEIPSLGRRFNDIAVAVPIKKRRIQMVEIMRSPSPPPRPSSPVTNVESSLKCPSPVSEHALINTVDFHGDVLCNDIPKDMLRLGKAAEDNRPAEGLQPNLVINTLTENVAPGCEDKADARFLDESRVPRKEDHASCLELVVSTSVDDAFVKFNNSRLESVDISSQKDFFSRNEAADDRELFLGSSAGASQKVELQMNDMDDKEGMLSSLPIKKPLQNKECQLLISSDDRGTPSKLTSGCARDDRLHWDLNMEMDAWEQASDEQLCEDNLPSNKYDLSQSVNSSFHQTFSGKSKANSENTVDEAISKNDLSMVCDGQSEGNEIEPAYVAESVESDAYDEEDEPISDTDRHPSECVNEDQAGNQQHQSLNELAGDGGEELEVEEHVDYGDSDCREADDIGLEGYEKLPVTQQVESDWKFEELNGTTKLHSIDKKVSLEEDANVMKSDPHLLRELYCMNNEMMEEDGELLPHLDGTGMQESDNQQVDDGGVYGSLGKVLQEVDCECERVLQLSESNVCNKDLSDKSEVQHETDNQPGLTSESRFPKHIVSNRTKSSGWDQLPEGFDTVEDALKAVKENSTCQRATTSWAASRPGSSLISSQGLSTDGRHGSGSLRGLSSRVDGSLGGRGKPYELSHGRDNTFYHRRLEGGFESSSRFPSSREAVRGRTFGRESGAGRFRVDHWMDGPGGQWGQGRRRSPGRCTGSSGPNSRGPTNAAALAAAKVQSSGFVVAPDGTIIKAGNAGATGRSGMHASGIIRSHTMSMRGPTIDHDAGMDFQTRISMQPHRSTGPRSKLVRQTPSPPSRNEEDRSNERECKRLMSRVHTPSRRTSPHLAHGSALIDERGRQNIDATRRISPTRLKQGEQTGKHPLRFIGRPMDDDQDNRRYKRDHDDIGRFSGAYRRPSPKSVCYRDRDHRPTFDSRREQNREDERREKILNRDIRHISGFRHTSNRNFDDDVAPRRRRPS